MNTQERTNINEPEVKRGTLVYIQEDGYKLLTMTISLAANEQSRVISTAYDIPIQDEAEHLIIEVDLYHFVVTDGTHIQLTIDSPEDIQEAHYTVQDAIIQSWLFYCLTCYTLLETHPAGLEPAT